MITKQDIAAVFSAAYARASLRDDCDMRLVADLFESIKPQLDISDPYNTWDFIIIDSMKFDNDLSVELLSDLKESYNNLFYEKLLSHINSIYSIDNKEAMRLWELTYAEAAVHFREDLIGMLCYQQLQWGIKNEVLARYAKLPKLMQESRWPDAFPFYEEIALNTKFSDEIRAFAEIALFLIIIYEYLEFTKALKHLENAEALLPGHFMVKRAWGEYYLKNGETQKSRDYFLQVITMKPGDYISFNYIGDSFMAENKLESAESWYNDALRKNFLQTDSYRRLINLYGIKTWFNDKWPRIEELLIKIEKRPRFRNSMQLVKKGLANSDCFEDLQLYHTYRTVASVWFANDRSETAEEWYRKAIALHPETPTAYIDLAYLKLHLQQPEQAKELFSQALEADDDNFDLYWGLAYYYQTQKQKEESLGNYQKCLRLRPDWEDMICNFIGNLYYSFNEYNDAISYYRKAIEKNNQYPVYTNNLADACQLLADQYYGNQDYPAAEKYYLDAANTDNDAVRWNTLGNLYFELERWKDAADSYSKAIAIKKDPLYLENCGLAYERMEHFEEAEKHYLEALENDPESDKLFNRLGVFYYDRKEYDKSIIYYLKALEHQPEDLIYLENIALAYTMKDDYKAAIEIYGKFLQISPADAKIMNAIGVAYYNQQQYEPAIEFYRKALEIDTDNFLFIKNLGLACRVTGSTDEAIETYQRAIRINGEDFQVWNELGILFYEKGDFDNAIVNYEKAIDLQPNDPVLYSNLALVFNAQGKTEDALNVTANYPVSEEVKKEVNSLLQENIFNSANES